jgi:hypothetical protein
MVQAASSKYWFPILNPKSKTINPCRFSTNGKVVCENIYGGGKGGLPPHGSWGGKGGLPPHGGHNIYIYIYIYIYKYVYIYIWSRLNVGTVVGSASETTKSTEGADRKEFRPTLFRIFDSRLNLCGALPRAPLGFR